MRTIPVFLIFTLFFTATFGQIQPTHIFVNSSHIYPSNVFSSDSKLILGASRYIGNSNPSPEIWVIDLQSGEAEFLPKPVTPFALYNLAFIGEDLMFKGRNHSFWRINLDTYDAELVKDTFYTDSDKRPIRFNEKLVYPGTFITDGTTEGSFKLFDGDFDQHITTEDYVLLLDNQTGELWKTDGTIEGTEQIAIIEDGANLRKLWSDEVFYIQTGSNLWQTDGTSVGTYPILNFQEHNIINIRIYKGGNVGNSRIFQAETLAHGSELWITDGTSTGTHLLMDIQPGSSSSNPDNFTTINGSVFFTILNENYELEIWTSDGTVEGTNKRFEIEKEHRIQSFQQTKHYGNWTLFNAKLTGGKRVLAFLDDENFKLIDERGGNAFFVGDLFNFSQVKTKNYFYFMADNGQHGQEVWQVDSLGQVKMLGDLSPGARWTLPRLIGGAGEDFFFIARQRNQDPYTLYRFKENSEGNHPDYPTHYEWFQSISNTEPWYSDLYPNTCINSRLEIDELGNIYTMGTTRVPTSIATFQDTLLFENSENGAYYIVKLKPDGQADWLKVFQHWLAKPDQALHVDYENNILFGGRFAGPGSDSTAIIIKIDPNGTPIWTKEFNLGYNARIYQIISDKDGNYFVTGAASTGLRYFDDVAMDIERTGYFLSKFDKYGQAIWAKYISKDTTWEELNPLVGLSMDENNNIYFGVDNLYRFYAYNNDCDEPMPSEIKFYSFTKNGSKRWEKNITSDDLAYIADIEISPNNQVYLLGYFRNNLKFPDTILIREPCEKGQFLFKFDLEGNLIDTTAQTEEILFPFDLEFDNCGNYYIAGIRQMPSEATSFFYPNYYQFPFERGYRQNYVYKYNYFDHQREGRTFNKRKDDHFFTQLAIKDDQVLLQGNYSFILDTIPESSSYVETNKSFLLNFKFESGCTTYPEDEPIEPESDLFIVPNPTVDNLMVYTKENAENAQVRIFNSMGQIIAINTVKLKNGVWVNTNALNNTGVYYIEVQIGNKKITGSFIKH